MLQIPVYVWAPEEEGLFKPGRCSRWWLHQSLKAFEKDLAALGTSMVYRRSRESCISLVQLVQETGAQVRHSAVSCHHANLAGPVIGAACWECESAS